MATKFCEQIFRPGIEIRFTVLGWWSTFGALPHIEIGGEFQNQALFRVRILNIGSTERDFATPIPLKGCQDIVHETMHALTGVP